MQGSRVLVVDGDRTAREVLVTGLRFVGMEAHGAENVAAAQFWLQSASADVLVLAGAMAPDIAQDVAVDPLQPVIVLTRPTAVSRVVERIESLIEHREAPVDSVLTFGGLTLDVEAGRLTCGSNRVALGGIETRLLAYFIGVPDKVFSRAQLLHKLWPSNTRVAERTVDVYIGRLRVALAHLDCAGYIQTVRCSGYRFSAF